MSGCVGFNIPFDTQRGHFGDVSFQAIYCTGTDNQKQKYCVHPQHRRQNGNNKTN